MNARLQQRDRNGQVARWTPQPTLSRGGESRWENVITACGPCNRRKGNRTPEDAKMPLLHQPRRPRYLALTLLEGPSAPEEWGKYMYF